MPISLQFPYFDSLTTRHSAPPFHKAQPVITLARESESAPALDCSAAASITEFEAAQWNALVPLDEPQLRWDFLRAAEKSGLATGATYLAVRAPQAGSTPSLRGIAVVYRKDIDLLTLASPKLTNLANAIRKGPLRRFLIVRAISCGPVINNCRANFWVDPEIETESANRVAGLLLQRIKDLRGGALQVLFEFQGEAAARHEEALHSSGFIEGASLPGTRLDIAWESFESYTGAMRKFYRRAIRADQKAAQDLDIQIETDFSHLADEACALYQKTLERATVVVERLTPEFFRELAQVENIRLVTAREKSSGKLVGIEVLALGEKGVQDLYAGVDYDFNERYNLYFNLAYPGIALACENGLASVSMGQTSYAFKSRLGVESYPLHIFLRHRNPAIHAALKLFRKQIFPTVEVPSHRVFHEAEAAESKRVAV